MQLKETLPKWTMNQEWGRQRELFLPTLLTCKEVCPKGKWGQLVGGTGKVLGIILWGIISERYKVLGLC